MDLPWLKSLAAWRPGRLARSTAHAGMWFGARTVLQAANLVLLARVFGADGYGALSGALGLYITLAQFVGLGTGIAMVRDAARAGDSPAKLAAIEMVYLSTGLGLFLLVWPPSAWLFGSNISPLALALLALAELVVAPALFPLAFRYQAMERLSMSVGLLTLAPAARCVAILLAIALPAKSLGAFAALYLSCLAVATATAAWLLWPRREPAALGRPGIAGEIREGLPYAASGLVATAGAELDKTMMLHIAGELVTGQYSAAARVQQAAVLPVSALIFSAAPRWFRKDHPQGALAGSSSLFAAAIGYGVLAALGVAALAPFLPLLLGEGFDASVPLLRLLSVAILTGAVRQVVALLLTTSDRQAARNRIEIAAVSIALALMPVLISFYGAVGAVICLLVADVLVLGLGLAMLGGRARANR